MIGKKKLAEQLVKILRFVRILFDSFDVNNHIVNNQVAIRPAYVD